MPYTYSRYRRQNKANPAKSVLATFAVAALVIQLVFPVFPISSAQAANNGSIKTTTSACTDPVNENHYAVGDGVYIKGANFDEGEYDWTVTGQPGGASSDPDTVVASGTYDVDATGAFCFLAYTVMEGDAGEYKAEFGNKKDNYHVDGPDQGGEEEPVTGTLHIQKYTCDEDVTFTENMVPNSSGNATIPEGCEEAGAGWKIGAVFEEGNTSTSGPYPVDNETDFNLQGVTLLGTTNSSGEIHLEVPAGGRHFLAENDGDGNYPNTPALEGLIGLACTDDAGNHTNNVELVFVQEDQTDYCNVYNVRPEQPQEDSGTVVVTKYVCDDDMEFDNSEDSAQKPNNQGVATIPDDCELANDFRFGYIHEANNNTISGPYPGLDDNTEFTAIAGETGDDGTGKLILTNLPTGGRLDIAEVDSEGDRISDDDVFGFMCNEDSGIKNNNYEVVFNAPDKTTYCNMYNRGEDDGGTVVITKYVCEEGANVDNSDDSPQKPNNQGSATIPEGCELADGFRFGYIHEENKNDISGPYPGLDNDMDFTAIAGETGDDGEGKLIVDNLPVGGRLDIAELDSEGNRVSDDDVFGFMCNEDSGIKNNNYEVVFNAEDKTSYCNMYNRGDVGGENLGTLHITKYICEEGTEITAEMAPNTEGEEDIPQGCIRGEGFDIGYIFEQGKTDNSGPYPTNFQTLGTTDENGELIIEVLAGGRYDLSEMGDTTNFLGIACADDVGGNRTDNYEVTFVEAEETDYCNVFNKGETDVDTDIHFIKIICSSYSMINGNGMATVADDTNGNYVFFANYSDDEPNFSDTYASKPVDPDEIPEECDRAEGWSFLLSTDQAQTQNTQVVGATNGEGEFTININDLNEALKEALMNGEMVWISEVEQEEVASFGAFRCYNDALNGDNLEFVQIGAEFPDDIYCIAYNVDEIDRNPEVPCGENMLINGGFETPNVTNGAGWDVYANSTPGIGWQVEWVGGTTTYNSDDRPDMGNLEIHDGLWTAAEGSQYAELDSDWGGPSSGTSGEPANISLVQYVSTNAGDEYTLSYSYSPRPGVGSGSQSLQVYWNGALVDSITAAGGGNVSWTDETVNVTGINGVSKLEFREIGTEDSLGSFLDDVSLVNNDCEGVLTICKYDGDLEGDALPGWTFFLLGNKVGTVTVGSDGNDDSSAVLPAGDYILKASGTYTYRPNDPDASISDAAYSKRLESDAVYGGPYTPWVRVNDFDAPHTGWLGIQMEQGSNDMTDWGSAFNPDHVYYSGVNDFAGGSMTFRILDDVYSDNSGSLTVDIYEGFIGTTGDNGCIVFEDVPAGDYDLQELMQEGWIVVSGTGEVEITGDEQTINVINTDGQVGGEDNNIITGLKWEDDNGDGDRDEGDSGLSGVTIVAVDPDPVSTLTINADDTNGDSTVDLPAGSYLVKVSGTWTNRNGDDAVDADFASYDNFATDGFDGDDGWGFDDNENLLDLQVDEDFVDWGNYMGSHEYYMHMTTTGDDLNFRVFDGDPDTNTINAGWYGDNDGSLTVQIYDILDSDVTDSNGNYELNVPNMGDVWVFEVPQKDWMQTFPESVKYVINTASGDEFVDKDFGNKDLTPSTNGGGGGGGGGGSTPTTSSGGGGGGGGCCPLPPDSGGSPSTLTPGVLGESITIPGDVNTPGQVLAATSLPRTGFGLSWMLLIVFGLAPLLGKREIKPEPTT